MSHAETEVQIAIEDSIRENRIVHLKAIVDSQQWVDLAAALSAASEGHVETGSEVGEVREYWGADDDGDEWRIHLDGRLK